jgi:hypothetical protein
MATQESFGTKVGKITGGNLNERNWKEDKSNKTEAAAEEPRRCLRWRMHKLADTSQTYL